MLTASKTWRAAQAAVVLSLFLAGQVPAGAPARQAEHDALRRTLADVLAREPLKSSRVSMQVVSLDDGEVIFSSHPDDLLNPASNVKLFTSAAALVKLGPEYRFETEFLTDPDYREGRMKNLYVRGKGDPSVTTERLYNIVSELHHAGLREVAGDLVIDDSWFDAERLAPGYEQDGSDRAYKSPTGAVSLNWNAAGVYLRPGEHGGKATVEIEPPSDYFVVESTLQTGAKRFRRFSVLSQAAGDKQRIVVRGAVAADQGTVAVWKKIDSPPMYFGQTFKQMLADRGIKVRGRVKVGAVPEAARMVHVAQSETLDLVLKRLNKNSSNFVAETLIKTMGAELKTPPGSHVKGIDVVEEFLEKDVGIPRGTYVMKNGSGLNDTNRFSASQISRLLKYMFDRFPLAPEYLSALGIAGKDGTLRYRFEGSDAVGRLRAKTGTLEEFASLALSGYVQSLGGERLIFSTLVNDFSGRVGPVVHGIDALGVAMAASGSKLGPNRAVAELMSQQTVISSIEEAKARIRTYLALGKQGDQRNISFLRTAWRSEKDPAVRAVVAESIYRSNPQDYLGARALLDSISPNDEVYGRLRRVAREMSMETPGVSAVVELSAEGNIEALSKLVELVKASSGDEASEVELAGALAEVARTAPDELIHVLQGASVAERDATVNLLAKGLVQAADPEHPFWPALRKAMGGVEPGGSQFARETERVLSLRIAQEKAPKPAVVDAPPARTSNPPQTAESRPGG